jgi:predicted transposase YdaD
MRSLSRPEVAKDFVLNFVPAGFSDLLRPSAFRLRKDSFVDSSLRERHSDLLYKVEFKDRRWGFVYILFEPRAFRPLG